MRPELIHAKTQQDLMVTVTITHVGELNAALSHCVNISPAGCGLFICNQSARHSNRKNLARTTGIQPNASWEEEGVCFTCVKVLAGFVGVHGAVTNRRLYCSQWRDYACAGKELFDGRAQVYNLSGLQGPIVEFRLFHTIS